MALLGTRDDQVVSTAIATASASHTRSSVARHGSLVALMRDFQADRELEPTRTTSGPHRAMRHVVIRAEGQRGHRQRQREPLRRAIG